MKQVPGLLRVRLVDDRCCRHDSILYVPSLLRHLLGYREQGTPRSSHSARGSCYNDIPAHIPVFPAEFYPEITLLCNFLHNLRRHIFFEGVQYLSLLQLCCKITEYQTVYVGDGKHKRHVQNTDGDTVVVEHGTYCQPCKSGCRQENSRSGYFHFPEQKMHQGTEKSRPAL